MDALLQRLDRIEAKLDSALGQPPAEIIGVTECMRLTGCKSIPAIYRWFKTYQVKPYSRGKYIRLEITNKVTALRLFPAKPGQLAHGG